MKNTNFSRYAGLRGRIFNNDIRVGFEPDTTLPLGYLVENSYTEVLLSHKVKTNHNSDDPKYISFYF